MSETYTFDVRITLHNTDGYEDVVFEAPIPAIDEDDLIRRDSWRAGLAKAREMADERSDDGTGWDVSVHCMKVTAADGTTDWVNDLMPQRDEVTEILAAEARNAVREHA